MTCKDAETIAGCLALEVGDTLIVGMAIVEGSVEEL
jgi:hypothetical protein